MTDRVYYLVCLALGRLLRSSRYSQVYAVRVDGELQVRKRRRFYAPVLVWLGEPMVRMLDTGVRVLPQGDWEEREQLLWRTLRGTSARVEVGGTIVLPHLRGETLASLLEDPKLVGSVREKAIELAVVALADFHHRGYTHGDAMAENVMVDLGAGVAHWFDFETIHDPSRPLAWRRADDVRALLATCLLRTRADVIAETLTLILDAYYDEEVTRYLAKSFTTPFSRPLTYHLAQASLSYSSFRQIGELLNDSD